MSRKIKYRVWDEEKKKYCTEYNAMTLKHDGEFYIERGWCTISGGFEVEQYTGLKDINGKEIYEEDIVELDWYIYGDKPAYRVRSEVIFDEEGARVCNGKHSDLLKYCTGIEVIGNIHENPELLEN